MPSKRTNDSVDRILEDLNMQQAEAGLRDSVTDHQVDEILRSVGISVETPQPPTGGGAAFSAADGLDDLLRTPRPQQPAPQPKRAAPYTAQPPAAPQPRVQPAPQPVQPAPAQPPVSSDTTLGFNGDTTRTGIIKGFLLKMAPDGGNADAAALNQGKNQFQKFFKDSVAVVPDLSLIHIYARRARPRLCVWTDTPAGRACLLRRLRREDGADRYGGAAVFPLPHGAAKPRGLPRSALLANVRRRGTDAEAVVWRYCAADPRGGLRGGE